MHILDENLTVIKKILFISYYFPPMGMGGVQRSSKFVKYLPDFGWEVTVLTSAVGAYYAFDYTLLDELNKEHIEIIRTGTSGQAMEVKNMNEKLRKFLGKSAQIFLVPDTKRLWKNKAKKFADKIIAENKPDVIFATAPPYTDFMLGYELSKKYDIPLVTDYRDAWADCPYNFYLTPFHKMINMNYEKKILEHAKKVITINQRIKELLVKRYGEGLDGKIEIVSQGFDPEDFREKAEHQNTDGKFRLLYAGSFFHFMTPEYFFEGARAAVKKNPQLKEKLVLEFAGYFPDMYKPDDGDEFNIEYLGYIPHNECTRKMTEADVLWMMIGGQKGSDMISTGKIYDYIGSRKPVIACVPESEAKRTLKEYGNAKICSPYNSEEISEAILHYYNLFTQGKLPQADASIVEKYNRRLLAGKLSEIIQK